MQDGAGRDECTSALATRLMQAGKVHATSAVVSLAFSGHQGDHVSRADAPIAPGMPAAGTVPAEHASAPAAQEELATEPACPPNQPQGDSERAGGEAGPPIALHPAVQSAHQCGAAPDGSADGSAVPGSPCARARDGADVQPGIDPATVKPAPGHAAAERSAVLTDTLCALVERLLAAGALDSESAWPMLRAVQQQEQQPALTARAAALLRRFRATPEQVRAVHKLAVNAKATLALLPAAACDALAAFSSSCGKAGAPRSRSSSTSSDA